VSSVTVTFNPHPARLAEQIAGLLGQVDEIIIVDNGSDLSVEDILQQCAPRELQESRIKLVALKDNQGVARGFNIGIGEARRRGAGFVLLLDHDSIPAPDMVPLLMAGYRRCVELAGSNRVAAVGPRVNDSRDRLEYPFIRMGWLRNRHLRCGDAGEVVACDFLISSGCLISMQLYPAIGEFDEALFIDSVDLEWCCRARSRDFALYGVCAAELDHRLGDHRRVFGRVIHLVVHSPERVYYMTRNRFLLYQRAYMPLKWKLKDLLRFLAKFAATVLLVRPRRENARMTLWAIRDAVAGRGGKLRYRRSPS
jgi:rhamnosyltransferase